MPPLAPMQGNGYRTRGSAMDVKKIPGDGPPEPRRPQPAFSPQIIFHVDAKDDQEIKIADKMKNPRVQKE